MKKKNKKIKIKTWQCQLCGAKSFNQIKPSSCSGSGNALGCDGKKWKIIK